MLIYLPDSDPFHFNHLISSYSSPKLSEFFSQIFPSNVNGRVTFSSALSSSSLTTITTLFFIPASLLLSTLLPVSFFPALQWRFLLVPLCTYFVGICIVRHKLESEGIGGAFHWLWDGHATKFATLQEGRWCTLSILDLKRKSFYNERNLRVLEK